MNHSLSPTRIMSRNQSISPQSNISRPPSPPLPYSPNRDHFNSDNMLPRDRPERSPKRKIHKRPSRDFKDQHKINNFSSSPPESRSPDMHRFRSGDHSRHQIMDEPIRFDNRSRCSGSPPGYFRNNYSFKSSSPDNRSFSPNHGQSPMSPPSLWDSPLRDRPPYSNNRLKRRRSSPRRDHSRDRRRRRYHFSPRETRRRISPPERSPMKHRDNPRKRPNKNQEGRKRDTKDRKRRSQSNPKSRSQEPQPIYPHGVVQLPPPLRPFPPIIPLRPPHFPSMGAWRPRMPPPSGWPYPCPRPYYFPF
ncbi:Hypothetical protein CINCED_3A002685 [Cinara cedri]|nr:Hypothetical protein CINCED_3A002685 [Cinara cedri]